jgi:plasmid stability protein
MATIHVREVSEETLTVLKMRAARAGQSLQAYVRQLLDGEAATLTAAEAAAEARSIAARGVVTVADVVDAIAQVRDART